METNVLNNEVCPIELMLETISPQYVNDYINKNFFDIIYNSEGKEKYDFLNLILYNFSTRRNFKVVYREIPKMSIKHKEYKQIIYDNFVDALINNPYDSITIHEYVSYFCKIYNKKAKQTLLDFIKEIPVTDLCNKDCGKLIKRSNDAELNERLWNKIVNNNPTWGDLNYLWLYTEHYKEKAGELLAKLYPILFLKEYNYQEYENILIKNKMGEEAFKEFSELRQITKTDFFEIAKYYESIQYEKNVYPQYVVISFGKKELNDKSKPNLYSGEYKISVKLVAKMLLSEFY
jgi:hypothetical protein